MTLKCLVVVAGLCLTSSVVSATEPGQESPEDTRLARLQYWAETLLEHEPGETDDRTSTVGSWSNRDLRVLAIDAGALVQAMRTPSRLLFSAKGEERPRSFRYTPNELRRLREIACALGGAFTASECKALKSSIDGDPALVHLSEIAGIAREGGDENFLLRRGALLHADIVMLGLEGSAEPLSDTTAVDSQQVKVTIADGQQTNMVQSDTHWDVARMLLDEVTPPGSSKPAPGRDDMVRLWYQATTAWMLRDEQHDAQHFDHARAIFPDDATLLFLIGSQHETYAGALIQTAARSAVLPTGIRIAIGSERAELRDAEKYYRRAVEVNPELAEAHLRLGRVLSLTGRYTEAGEHLRKSIALTGTTSGDAGLFEYFGSLFLGAVEEALGHRDIAKGSYERAAALYPLAQSPRLALSALARRAGNRDGALREIQQVFDLSPRNAVASDPWWTYHFVQGRHADALIEELRRPFLSKAER
jgi:tetratricopeptide (TPR) repeat protein